jgi:hypothetical protein
MLVEPASASEPCMLVEPASASEPCRDPVPVPATSTIYPLAGDIRPWCRNPPY